MDSDGIKLFASTAAKEIADSAIQVMGGYGYVAEYVVERLWRDSKLLEIGGGTIESHQKNITRDVEKIHKQSWINTQQLPHRGVSTNTNCCRLIGLQFS